MTRTALRSAVMEVGLFYKKGWSVDRIARFRLRLRRRRLRAAQVTGRRAARASRQGLTIPYQIEPHSDSWIGYEVSRRPWGPGQRRANGGRGSAVGLGLVGPRRLTSRRKGGQNPNMSGRESHTPKTIWLVDDDASFRELTSELALDAEIAVVSLSTDQFAAQPRLPLPDGAMLDGSGYGDMWRWETIHPEHGALDSAGLDSSRGLAPRPGVA